MLPFRTKEDILEIDNALEGVFWTTEARLRNLLLCSEQAAYLNPFKFKKPFVKSFNSFEEYEQWKKENSDPYWRFG
ncbi:MAG: hypothetical protein HQM15_11475 [Deltaproteobacteria bacterium]|nr:hypothetical protein [Deltaproteobacteria bacterium]